MMTWFEKLGFDDNPFLSDPRKNHDKLINLETAEEEIFYRISSGSILVVEGSPGSGRTSLLMMAANKFGGKKNVVYVDCRILDKNLNITHVLQDKYGIWGRMLNKTPKNMVVLLDNINELSKQNTERLKFYFDQDYIKSIIFTTDNYKKAKFSDSLRDRIGNRFVKIPDLNDSDAVEIIKSRVGNNEIFNQELITKIFKISGNSPKRLLENCSKVADVALKKGRKRVQLVDLKILTGDKK